MRDFAHERIEAGYLWKRPVIVRGACSSCYNARMLPELQMGAIVRLRKPHPCGGFEWKVVRLGADIGLECLSCGRRVLLPRRTLARRLKSILPEGEDEHSNP